MSERDRSPSHKPTPDSDGNRPDSRRTPNIDQTRRNTDENPPPQNQTNTGNADKDQNKNDKQTKKQEKQEQKEKKEKEKLEKKMEKDKKKGKGVSEVETKALDAKNQEPQKQEVSTGKSRGRNKSRSAAHLDRDGSDTKRVKASSSTVHGPDGHKSPIGDGSKASGVDESVTKTSKGKMLKSFNRKKSKTIESGSKSKIQTQTQITYNTDEEIATALIEIGVFIVFLILSTWVGLNVRDNNMFYFNDTIKKMFILRENMIAPSISIAFEKIMTVPDWWDYLQYNFIPTLHIDNVERVTRKKQPLSQPKNGSGAANAYDYRSYGDSDYVDANYEGVDIDDDVYGYQDMPVEVISKDIRQRVHTFLKENILLGPPRLRQVRVEKRSCDINDAFVRYFNKCFAPYSKKVEDRGQSVGGVPWRSMVELKTTPLWTKLNLYDGGGFSIDLTYDRITNLHLIKKYATINWVDRGSRLCLVEFNLFNLNTKLLQSTKLIAEMPPTGGVIPQAQIQSVKQYTFFSDNTVTRCSCYIAWYSFVIYYTISEYIEMRNVGFTMYLKSLMNIMEVLIIMFAYIAFIYNIWHALEIEAVLKKAAVTDGYQSFDRLCFWNVFYVDMMGILVFLVWLKIFKFISFNKTLIQFTTTLSRCSKDLAGFGLMFTIVFMAYAQLGLLLFGTKNPDFVDLLTSVLTMVRMILGDFQYVQIEQANRILGPVYFLTYILLVFFILLNMFLAIIMSTYNQVKREITEGRSNLGLYVYKRLAKALYFMMHCGRPHRPQSRVVVTLDDTQDDVIIEKSEAPLDQRKNTTNIDSDRLAGPSGAFAEHPVTYNRDINRLNNRVALLEEILEQLVINMDNILKRVENKTKG